MSKLWDQLRLKGIEPWDYEWACMVEQGMPEHEAKSHVIMRWMKAGDFRPMLAAIKKNGLLREPVLGLLVRMIETGELVFKHQGRGRPPDPEAAVRDMFNADTYEDFLRHYQVSSEGLFEAIGSVSGVGHESARQAVKAKRKSARK